LLHLLPERTCGGVVLQSLEPSGVALQFSQNPASEFDVGACRAPPTLPGPTTSTDQCRGTGEEVVLVLAAVASSSL
jgi:hypothetical protein